MSAKTFCGFLNLQSGVTILAFSFIEIAIIILISNLHLTSFSPSVVFVLCFVLGMFIVGVAMMAAAYREDRNVCLVALVFLTIVALMFLVGSALSFANRKDMLDYVCVEDRSRCPETLWCAPLEFRKTVFSSNGTDGNNTTEGDGKFQPTTGGPDLQNHTEESNSTAATFQRQQVTKSPNVYKNRTESKETLGYVIGPAFIAAIVLFVINLIFFAFCIHSVFSYYQELNKIHKLHQS